MLGDAPRDLPQRFSFVLLPNFSMMPVTAAVEPLRIANRLAEKQIYDWQMLTVDGEAVSASNGLTISADGGLADVRERSCIVVCGGVDIQKHASKALLNWLRKMARQGVDVGSLCTACFVLAKASLLNNYRCTIHWENMPSFAEAFPEIEVSGSLFEIDRDRFTCAGGTAAIDMMLAVISAQHGPDLAAAVAEQIIHSPIRHHSEHQRMSLPARIGARHPKLIGIIERMEDNLEEPLSPSTLAKEVGLSTRQLERLFRRYLDRSPKRYYLELRLKKARLLLLQTDMSVINVALACGFSSPSHFSKCYRAFYGRTPYREQGVPSGETLTQSA